MTEEEEILLDNQNDIGLAMLLNGEADAVWVYSDQAKNYQCDEEADLENYEQNCDMWSRFGTDFAYIHSGMYGHTVDGTTVAFTKKGSGLIDILNPCIDAFMETEAYYDACVKHG